MGSARHWLSNLLTKSYAAILDDVLLLACEVITNAVLHSDSAKLGEDGRPGTVTIHVLDTDDAVRVEVVDAGSESTIPHVIEDGPDALHGRGLYMLAVLSDRWASYADGNGRTTWFEVATHVSPESNTSRP